jgi:hypothetical protein
MTRSLIRSAWALAGLYLLPIALTGQHPDPWAALTRPRTHAPSPTRSDITPADLMTRIYLFADDSMRGRLMGSRGNAQGVEYIAAELARLGLVPAGDSGTFFQQVPVVTRAYDDAAILRIGTETLTPWVDFVPRDQGPTVRSIDGVPVVYGGTWGVPASLIPPEAARGKVVLLGIVPAGYSMNIPGAANRQAVTARYPGAAGIVLASLELMPPALVGYYREPVTQLSASSPDTVPALLHVTRRVAGRLLGSTLDDATPGAQGPVMLSGFPRFVDRRLEYPARNVVAILPGSDSVLRHEYVAVGAHNDHIGTTEEPVAHDSMYVLLHLFRQQGADDPQPQLTPEQTVTLNTTLATIRAKTGGASARLDSIVNGADDDASGSMGLLEIAEQYAGRAAPPKRSLLFIWHVGEEQGLFGSEFFTDHPTVPRERIVAQLNMDMIGRGNDQDVTGKSLEGGRIQGSPDYVQLIGSRRLSTELGNLAEEVNRASPRPLVFDYAMDANGHPQNIYCRSDHWSYARFGIPIVFFSTGGHADYHQVTDEPQYVDYDRAARVTLLVSSLAERIANLDHRVAVDQPKGEPGGVCRQ